MTTTADRTTIRSHAKEIGAETYRIQASGQVDYYGRMPNTNQIGWYFRGWDAAEVAAEIRSEDEFIAAGHAIRSV